MMKSAALLLSLFALIGTASARHHRSSVTAEPGTFDYYLLSLSWSPAFCVGSPGAAECGGPRRFGFIVHGLWPQNERGWPQYCDVHQEVPDSVVDGISELMPARALVYHEWSAHGTCSGLGSADYFALVRRAYNSIAIPREFLAVSQAVQEAPDAIVKAFLGANARLTPDSILVTCSGQGLPRLREVHICLDRTLNPRACSADAARGACRAPTLIVPPLR